MTSSRKTTTAGSSTRAKSTKTTTAKTKTAAASIAKASTSKAAMVMTAVAEPMVTQIAAVETVVLEMAPPEPAVLATVAVETAALATAEAPVLSAAKVALDSFMAAIGQAAGGSAFYVQVGANDGRMADPVYLTAKRNDWRGLLIEPHPTYFATLGKRYRRRAGFTLLQVGISDAEGTMPLYHLENDMMAEFPLWVHGSASVDKSRVERQVRLACRKTGQTYDPAMVARTDVPMRRLDEVLAEQAVTSVDLIVIDVEGHELAVMASVDLKSLSLRGMLVECNGKNAVQKPDYVAALNAAGLIVYELRDDLCAFDPARLTVDLAAEFDAAGLPRLGK